MTRLLSVFTLLEPKASQIHKCKFKMEMYNLKMIISLPVAFMVKKRAVI